MASSSLEVWALVAAALGLVYYWFTLNFDYWKKRGIKHDKPLPIFGNLFQNVILRKNQGMIVTDLYNKYKDEKVVGFYNFQYPALVIRDPELVYKIWGTDFQHFANNEIEVDEKVDIVISRNLFAQKDEVWKRNRQVLSPAFTTNKVKTWYDDILSCGEKLLAYIAKQPEDVNLKKAMSLYTSDVVSDVGLGIRGDSFEKKDPQVYHMGNLIFGGGVLRGIKQICLFLLPTICKLFKIRFVPKEVSDFFEHILIDVIRYRDANNDDTRRDMMQYWINLRKKSLEVVKGNIKSDIITREFTEKDILGGCITFFSESYETTALTTSFLVWHLALEKDIQEKVKKELEGVLKANNGKLTFEGITSMSYLQNAILETLRLHPVIWVSSKVCTKRYNMDLGNGKSLVVEEGTAAILPNMGLGVDPKYWKDPEKFDPDRFLTSDRPKGVFQPFGEGPRICIGMRLGVTIVKVAVSTLLRDFEIVPSKNTSRKFVQDPTHFMSSQKGGLKVNFVKRKN